jgi:lipoprotein-anchoring transpeptidase ErfK/SrfK
VSFKKLFVYSTIVLFILIGVMGFAKKKNTKSSHSVSQNTALSNTDKKEIAAKPIVEKKEVIKVIKAAKVVKVVKKEKPKPSPKIIHKQKISIFQEKPSSKKIQKQVVKTISKNENAQKSENVEPKVDRIYQLFTHDSSKLPIVETITYTSRVPWLKGRPAWISDYASFYETSRHFIARSLNKKVDYFTQNISFGDRFNVLKNDIDLEFYLVIDISKCRMWFYALNKLSKENILLKTYPVGLGRKDTKKPSGCLTPIGKYSLGKKIAIYKMGSKGYFQDRKIEMMRVFGTRWIPFDKEIKNCSDYAKGLGIHGCPWIEKKDLVTILEDREKISKYDSDGCVRLLSEDVEELFSIIITKPTTIEIVKDYKDAKIPGIEILKTKKEIN